MIIKILLPILFVALAAIFLMGKGDKLIAGYNTASEEERQQVNIQRLRLLMAIISLLTSIFCGLLIVIGDNTIACLTATGIFLVVLLIFVILANTWTKKK